MSPTVSPTEPVLAFDGDCGFCQAAIKKISSQGRPSVHAMPWQFLPQSMTEPYLDRLDREVLLLANGRVLASGAEALAAYMKRSPALCYRVAGAAICMPLLRQCAHGVYRWVARNRHRMPGGSASCAMPSSHS
ncbi:thiol-disulfide oxidoreductase DCC family protein [Streptomyces inhibens]|uniref:thiol-disulfide oxidoreductase DCC family protein n=1 Tax=Streptomyces inhibens TaxID=2293571 RepID=UPI001EE7342D|nr:DCC1-like thiol-disulfide oxidoreductase family protein [Streptomyces inhibens]UKY47833.1 DUF393 domain-containing protein [Streptomyces inhibens]